MWLRIYQLCECDWHRSSAFRFSLLSGGHGFLIYTPVPLKTDAGVSLVSIATWPPEMRKEPTGIVTLREKEREKKGKKTDTQ